VKRVAWGALLAVVSFWGSVGLQPFYDDWAFPSQAALALRDGTSLTYLTSAIGRHWSPLWNLIALANLSLAGWYSDLLIRAITLAACGGALAWFVVVARRLHLSPLAVGFGMAVLALHHTRAVAIYSFDTYSQVLVDLASWIAAGLAFAALSDAGSPQGGRYGTDLRDRRWALAVLIPLVALLLKEQAVAGAIAVLFLLAVAWVRPRPGRPPGAADRRAAAVLAALLVAGVLAFALVRREAGVTFAGTEVYRLCVSCIPRNMSTIGGALVLPVRTLEVVDAWNNGEWSTLALAAAGAGLVVVFLAAAFRRREAVLVAALLMLSTFPVAILGHVGELYAHTSVFWFAILMAVAADQWRTVLPAPPGQVALRVTLSLAMGAYLLSLGLGLRANLGEMRATGELAALWRGRYDEAVAALPAGSVVLIRGELPVKNRGDYSLYRLTSPDMITLMWVWAKRTPADERLEVMFEWSDVDQAALARRAEREPVFDLRRSPDGIDVTTFGTAPGR
jgi:hypothetical protein